jgi:uncharacterized protein YecE (DUF72 family)
MILSAAIKDRIRVGPAGWSYRDWVGPVYPPGRTVDGLRTIARRFDAIELNSSFYRVPCERLVESWAKRIEELPRFLFTVKVLQRFTHALEGTRDEARDFIRAFRPLEEAGRLGAFLIQFPWSFADTPENRRHIERLGLWFEDVPAAVEVRHGSWNERSAIEAIAAAGLAFCNIDQPAIGVSIPPTEHATTPALGYIRLHGRNRANWFRRDAGRDERYDYLYTGAELAEWRDRAARLAEKVDRLFIITNNHFRGQALVNALQLRSLLEGRKVEVPRELAAAYPVLREIDAGDGMQGRLL